MELFPFARLRTLPKDELGTLLTHLGEDHQRSKAMVEDITGALMQHPAENAVHLSTSICGLIQPYVARSFRSAKVFLLLAYCKSLYDSSGAAVIQPSPLSQLFPSD